MLNPFILLNPALLDAMLKQKMYFVRQYYTRGSASRDKPGTIPLLLTHYIHHQVDTERAKRHMRLIRNDPYSFLYNSTDTTHFQRLLDAAKQPAGYKIYVNLLLQKWEPPLLLRRKIDIYMAKRYEWWQFNRSQRIRVQIQDLYGQLYLLLSWKGNKVEVLLDEVENIDQYVL